DKYPFWAIENWHVYSDPRARHADPTNPDRPPMPPDDPAAYDLSPNPQKPGKQGVVLTEGTGYLELIAQWDRENRERAAQEEAGEKKKQAETANGPGEPGRVSNRIRFRVVPVTDHPAPGGSNLPALTRPGSPGTRPDSPAAQPSPPPNVTSQ